MASMDGDDEFARMMLTVIAEQAVLDGDLVLDGLTDDEVKRRSVPTCAIWPMEAWLSGAKT